MALTYWQTKPSSDAKPLLDDFNNDPTHRRRGRPEPSPDRWPNLLIDTADFTRICDRINNLEP
jgi:hypothetical protein